MSVLPFHSGFDATIVAAFWLTVTVVSASVILFFYTLGYRFSTIVRDRRRRNVAQRWREIIAAAALSSDDAGNVPLPEFTRLEHADLFHEWNLARETVREESATNLVILAKRMGLDEIARGMLDSGQLQSQLAAIQTLGNVGDESSWNAIEQFLQQKNTALSVTAAAALVNIDPPRAIQLLMPMIGVRRDWSRTRVSRFLRSAGSEACSEPLFRAIRGSRPVDTVYFLQFAEMAESAVIDAITEDLIRSSNEPSVLSAALRLISGHAGVPRIVSLVQHNVWYVRMHAAKVLGRVGQPEHLSLLQSLLSDREWWVRYRAAQAITSLPFLGPNRLRQIRDGQKDAFARDMLEHVLAEVGLA